jgi:hypothetical protein
MIPTMKNVGRTVFGVRIGCHAFKRCCLKAVSTQRFEIIYQMVKNTLERC